MTGNINELIKKAISGLGILVMLVIIINSIFFPTLNHIASYWRRNSDISEAVSQNILAFILAAIVIAFFILLARTKEIKNQLSHIIAIVFSTLFFVYLLGQYQILDITSLIDDSSIVFNAAQDLLDTGKISTWYMASNPQNLFIMLFYMFSIKLTGTIAVWNLYILFSLMHVITALLIYLSTRKLFSNNNYALIAHIIFIFTLQINLHVIVMYTDVYSMFFLMVGIYLFISYTKSSKQTSRIIFLFASSIFFSFAYLAKGFYLILFIALALGMLISSKGKERLSFIIPVITFLIVTSSWNAFISSQNIFEKEDIGMPNTHYIFMGMNTKDYFQDEENKKYRLAGAFNDGDLGFSKGMYWDQNLESDEIASIHLEKTTERIKSISFSDFLEFLFAKVSSTWSSGDLKSTVSIGMATNSENGLQEFRESVKVYTYLQMMQYIYYLIFLLVFIKLFFSPSANSFLNISVFFVIGIFFFTLMWESSPRYAMTIMPFAPVIFPYFLQSFSCTKAI